MAEQSFHHYSLKHRAIAWISQNLFRANVYTVGHGLNKGLKRKGGLGFLPEFLAGSSETEETRFWSTLDLRGKVVFDVGAFEGILACFFARQAKYLVCFEPNPVNHERLVANLNLNNFTNVTPRRVGLGSLPDSFTMVWDPLIPGGASLEKNTQDGMRAAHASRIRSETIQVVTLDSECESGSFPPPDFIKVDVEGLELEVLKGATATLLKHHPDLFLEMHGETMSEKMQKVAAIVEFLIQHGYNSIVHLESGQKINPANSGLAARGHLYCKATAGLPR